MHQVFRPRAEKERVEMVAVREMAQGNRARSVVMGTVSSLNSASREDGSWVVGTLTSDDGSTRLPFIGTNLGGCEPGRTVRMVGEWERHHKYGYQFRAREVESHLPTERDAIIRYMSGSIRGCGPSRAERILDHLGPSCLEVLASDPQKVVEAVPGKPGERLADGFAAWGAEYANDRLLVRLMGAGLTSGTARKVRDFFATKGGAEEILLKHPYRLVDVPGIGFRRADGIARRMGVSLADPSRIAAGVVFSLERVMEAGHTGATRDDLELMARRELDCAEDGLVPAAVARCLASRTLVEDRGLLYLPEVLAQERFVATWLAGHVGRRPASGHRAKVVRSALHAFELSREQEDAVWMGVESRVSLLAGRPGSGKTTTTRAFVACCEALGWRVEIAAPTGKAASRIAEVSGRPASTIHRMIGTRFPGRREIPIDADVIVLDEASMVDLPVFAWLLGNVNTERTRLLFVGDPNQLPSVQHGRVFGDMLDSGRIPSVELARIFRQAEGSRVITNAHRLLDGLPLVLDNQPGTNFLFADVTDRHVDPDGFPVRNDPDRSLREQEDARARVRRAIRFLVRTKGAVPSRDIQVISPLRRGVLGVDALNQDLQDALNPEGEEGPAIGGGLRARVGDRVIQTRNDYSVAGGLFNGEQGVVSEVDSARMRVRVRFDGRHPWLERHQISRLRHAWAITVHRSQGSEFPYAILVYHTSHFVMLDWRLLYTAITRAQNLFVLIGNHRALATTLRSARDPVVRNTRLGQRLADSTVGAGRLVA